MEVTVAAVQPRTYREREERNVSNALKYIDDAADGGAKIVCFPEGYPGPYRGPISYSPLEDLCKKAREKKVYVIAGMVERAENYKELENVYYLVSKLIGPDGRLLGTYRRCQPNPPQVDKFFMGGKIIAPGEKLEVYETDYGKIGISICGEIWWPELYRVLALKGAEIIFTPIGGALYELYDNWRLLVKARATENHVYVVGSCNIWGMEDGLTIIAGPEDILAETRKTGIITATLDLDRIKWLREQDAALEFPRPFKSITGNLRRRRPELYREICEKLPLNAYDYYYFKKK